MDQWAGSERGLDGEGDGAADALQVLDARGEGFFKSVLLGEGQAAEAVLFDVARPLRQRCDFFGEGRGTIHGDGPSRAAGLRNPLKGRIRVTNNRHAAAHRLQISAGRVALAVTADEEIDAVAQQRHQFAGEVERSQEFYVFVQSLRIDRLPHRRFQLSAAADQKLERDRTRFQFGGDADEMIRAFDRDEAAAEGEAQDARLSVLGEAVVDGGRGGQHRAVQPGIEVQQGIVDEGLVSMKGRGAVALHVAGLAEGLDGAALLPPFPHPAAKAQKRIEPLRPKNLQTRLQRIFGDIDGRNAEAGTDFAQRQLATVHGQQGDSAFGEQLLQRRAVIRHNMQLKRQLRRIDRDMIEIVISALGFLDQHLHLAHRPTPLIGQHAGQKLPREHDFTGLRSPRAKGGQNREIAILLHAAAPFQ
jgi:hypothetical protein